MEAEPPKAEPPKRKRRWFQFSLRTLLIVVALLAAMCAYLVHEVRTAKEIVEERKAFGLNPHFLVITTSQRTVSWIRRALGDLGCERVIADDKASDSELERCRLSFPEADVQRDKDLPEGGFHFRQGIVIAPKRK